MSRNFDSSWNILLQSVRGASRSSVILVPSVWLLACPASALIDTNENNLSDLWEKQYNNGELFPGNFDPQADPDSDGWTNAQEAAAGTDPYDPKPPVGFLRPQITQTPATWHDPDQDGNLDILTPETLTISWPTVAGKLYTLQLSPDLSAGAWIQAAPPFIGNGDINEYNIVLPAADKLFWCVAVTDNDTDGDGLTDAEEGALGTNPNAADTDGDGVPDGVEKAQGTDATSADSDDDTLRDGEDADPKEPSVDWRMTSEPRFVVVELPVGNPEGLLFDDLSEHGTVLFTRIENNQPVSRLLVDFNLNSHTVPSDRPELNSPIGYFGSYARTLIGKYMLGERVVANPQTGTGMNQDCLWDPVMDTYIPYPVLGYHDDIFDDRGNFRVDRISVPSPATLKTPYGPLAGSNAEAGSPTIEMNGNIVAQNGYWRFDPPSQSYGEMSAIPENSAGCSATLSQTEPSATGGQPIEHRWNLIAGVSKLIVSKNSAAFTQTGIIYRAGQVPIGVTNQGWLATHNEIWANGKWKLLKDLVSGTPPADATLLGMHDTGVGVARLDFNSGPSKIVLIAPVEVSWQAYTAYDNVDDHIDPWTKSVNGKRIFPDFEDPTKTTIRHEVEVVVKTSPALVGKAVFVKSFDVDDSTSEEFDKDVTIGSQTYGIALIDPYGKAGGDNFTDYLSTPQSGRFWTGTAWGTEAAQGIVDANGEAKFILQVGMQPGSNYRVVASVMDEALCQGVQTGDPAVPKYLGSAISEDGGAPASPLLTVWRRLWVENDSMGAIPVEDGNLRNDLTSDIVNPEISGFFLDSSGVGTILVISPISDFSSFCKLEHGNIIFQGSSHPVTGTAPFAPGQSGAYAAKISGDHTSYPTGTGFMLYDDDGYGLDAAALPRQDLVNDQMKNYFYPSFVEVVDAASYNSPNLIPLRLNEDVSENNPVTVVDNEIDLTDKSGCWVCPIIAAYQGPQSEDQDPAGDPETFLMGETTPHGNYNDPGYYEFSTVFVETCRENYDGLLRLTGSGIAAKQPARLKKWITAVISHEMGHQPGNEADEHPEGGLMGSPMDVSAISPEDARFSPKTIKRFRKTNRWSK
jgi:hypothetical protein